MSVFIGMIWTEFDHKNVILFLFAWIQESGYE